MHNNQPKPILDFVSELVEGQIAQQRHDVTAKSMKMFLVLLSCSRKIEVFDRLVMV